MSELDEIRAKISATDKEIARLFESRMALAGQVIDYKAKSGLSILDADQEEKVISRNLEHISDPVMKEYYVLFIKRLMEISRAYQYRRMNAMKVSYSGNSGIVAANSLFPNAEYIPYPSFESAYKACEDGVVDVCILPIYNAYSGNIGSVIDLTFLGSLYINLETELSAEQHILGLPGSEINKIQKIFIPKKERVYAMEYLYSHNFEIEECEDFSNALSSIKAENNKNIAIVTSSEDSFGLQVLAKYNDSTKIAVFSRIMNVPVSNGRNINDHFLLVFTVRNQAGALVKALNIIGSHGFNMSNLSSRPMKDMDWNNFFYVELEGHISDSEKEELFRQLHPVCDKLKIVGYYKNVKL